MLEQGSAYFPSYVHIQFNLGIWQMRNLQWDNASRTFKTVMKLRPSGDIEAATKQYQALISEVRRRGAFGYNSAEELLLEGVQNDGPSNDIIINLR